MKLIFLGAPGAGKGTHATKVKADFGLPHISTGDIFRANLKEGTPLGLKAKGYMDKGELVPDELVIDLVKDRLTWPDCQNGYILDGFPRTIKQAEALDSFQDIDTVINLVLDDETIVRRVSGRRMCTCGATYNMELLNGRTTCEKCGKELYQREDDKGDTVRTRLAVYNRDTAPLIAYYRGKNLLTDIDCNGKSIDEVYQAICNALNRI